MTHSFDTSTRTTIASFNLALSYENVAVDRLENRFSGSIDLEIKEKLSHHLVQTREQQVQLKERINALGGEPIAEAGKLPIPKPPHSLKVLIERGSTPS
jgi:hypothetical protein